MKVAELKKILNDRFDDEDEVILSVGYADFKDVALWRGVVHGECAFQFYDLDAHLDDLESK